MEVSRKYSAFLLLFAALLAGCVDVTSDKALDPNAKENKLIISWSANHEKLVNSAGGGYKVYYSTDPTFSVSNAPFIDVPYVSGATAPTSVVFPLSGTYYIKVVAYSTLGTSSPSSQIVVAKP